MPSLSSLSPKRQKDAPPDLNTDASRTGMSKSAFTSKSRRVRFDLLLRIIDLNNVPLVSGTSFIKWHLPSSTAAEHRGSTNKVAYEYEKKVAVRLTVGKDGMLQECSVHFEVLQEYGAGGRGERIRLGDVKLNLAEYVEVGEAQSPSSPGPGQVGDEGVVRRYLMQESKINSTLKVGITMRHLEGTRDYYAPPLRTAPVFGGIAGIIHSSEPATTSSRTGAGDNANGEGGNEGQDPLPNLSSRNKEAGEMQDVYRRTLAAFWTSQPGELRADECVEDIFSGGDGWGKGGRPQFTQDAEGRKDATNLGFGGMSSRPGSGSTTPNPQEADAPKMGGSAGGRNILGMSSGGGGGRYHPRNKNSKSKGYRKAQGEIDEFDARDDMISWRVGERSYGGV
ncbi:hypothetical protein LTR37_001681 [Vermiconidia calcicola]|uniref:Uncharacterized protein n=1 Tax=Vermiconidia calcicola TaxID=1690605 RepID=A0ACC3NW79_9PEZI|nr:hypothetical protein LTR37_001681 [Vermiconidia calcicola]